jgi:hypothetical protein
MTNHKPKLFNYHNNEINAVPELVKAYMLFKFSGTKAKQTI